MNALTQTRSALDDTIQTAMYDANLRRRGSFKRLLSQAPSRQARPRHRRSLQPRPHADGTATDRIVRTRPPSCHGRAKRPRRSLMKVDPMLFPRDIDNYESRDIDDYESESYATPGTMRGTTCVRSTITPTTTAARIIRIGCRDGQTLTECSMMKRRRNSERDMHHRWLQPTRSCARCADTHYMRWLVHGDPLGGAGYRDGAPFRFLEQAKEYFGDECLIWPHCKSGTGRGGLAYITIGPTRKNRKTFLVSRLICEHAYGPPPSDSHQAAHSCGRAHLSCVARKHLRWATPQENAADKNINGTVLRGETVPTAKLSAETVLTIREMWPMNVSDNAGGKIRHSVRPRYHKSLAERHGPTFKKDKNVRDKIFVQNSPPPLDAAARDLLATVDYWVKHVIPHGKPDAGQLAMLMESATTLRRELRAKARAAA